MNPPLYTVSDNSFHTQGFPWIDKIVQGIKYHEITCDKCGAGASPEIVGDLHVVLAPQKGSKWPDVIGCGVTSLLMVSKRILNDWKVDKVGDVPVGGEVLFVSPLPKRLEGIAPPSYFWLDPKRMVGADLNQEASGYVGVKRCSTCGRLTWDVSATYKRQESQPWSYVLSDWNGASLFTTSVYGGLYFCTEIVVECAQRHRHTNFRFVPIDGRGAPGSNPGLEYLLPNSSGG